MRRGRLVPAVLVIALSTAAAFAQAPIPAELIKAQQEWSAAAAAADKENLARFLTDDFTFVDADGRLRTKTVFIEEAGRMAFTPNVDIRAYPGGAIIVGTRALQSGAQTRFMQVWVPSGEDWRMAAHQGTLVGSEPAAPAGAVSSRMPASDGDPAERQAIRQVADAIDAGTRKNDPAPFLALTTDQFIGVTAEGSLVDKAGRAEAILAANPHTAPDAVKARSMRVHGDFAVMTMTLSGPRGRRQQLMAYAKVAGKWLQAGTAITPAPAPTVKP
jgi:hypothetical protein